MIGQLLLPGPCDQTRRARVHPAPSLSICHYLGRGKPIFGRISFDFAEFSYYRRGALFYWRFCRSRSHRISISGVSRLMITSQISTTGYYHFVVSSVYLDRSSWVFKRQYCRPVNNFMRLALTKKQKRVLDFIDAFQNRKGYSPTFGEIAKKFGFTALSTVHQYMDVLKRRGYIKRSPGQARSMELLNREEENVIEIPLLGIITAGKPMEAIGDPQPLAVPRKMLSGSGRHYALRISGNSMIGEGVFDGDIIIARQQENIENGQMAVAYLPDTNEATLKKVYKEKNRVRLQPANPTMKPIYETNVQIQGRVVGIIRKI